VKPKHLPKTENMIKFIPKLIDITSPLLETENFINNTANRSLATQLNEKFKGISCQDHPKFKNTMLVHFSVEGNIMSVQSYCCHNFKEKLDLIAQNRNPFPPDSLD
jgi:hypothetical protein